MDDTSESAGCPTCDAWAVTPLEADARYQTGAMLHWRTICPECNCVTFHDGHRMSLAAASALRDKFIDRACDDALSRTKSRTGLSEAVKFLSACFNGRQPWPWLFCARRVLERAWQAAERIGDDFPERPSVMDSCKYASPVQQNDMPEVLDAFGRILCWCAEEMPADDVDDSGEAKAVEIIRPEDDQAATKKAGREWPNAPPPEESRHKFGPLTGNLKQFTKLAEMDRRTLRSINEKSFFYIRKVNNKSFEIWLDSPKSFAAWNAEIGPPSKN